MTSTSTSRDIPTSAPVVELLAERWSPRSFDPAREVTDGELASLLEAARLAPSASNHQPRRFIVGRRGSAGFDRLFAGLNEYNQSWAHSATLLIANVAVLSGGADASFRWAEYDLGQAVAHLSVQAQALGLHTHQLGGILPEVLSESFALPAEWVPVSVTVVGGLASPDALPTERLRAREVAPRERLPLDELVIEA